MAWVLAMAALLVGGSGVRAKLCDAAAVATNAPVEALEVGTTVMRVATTGDGAQATYAKVRRNSRSTYDRLFVLESGTLSVRAPKGVAAPRGSSSGSSSSGGTLGVEWLQLGGFDFGDQSYEPIPAPRLTVFAGDSLSVACGVTDEGVGAVLAMGYNNVRVISRHAHGGESGDLGPFVACDAYGTAEGFPRHWRAVFTRADCSAVYVTDDGAQHMFANETDASGAACAGGDVQLLRTRADDDTARNVIALVGAPTAAAGGGRGAVIVYAPQMALVAGASMHVATVAAPSAPTAEFGAALHAVIVTPSFGTPTSTVALLMVGAPGTDGNKGDAYLYDVEVGDVSGVVTFSAVARADSLVTQLGTTSEPTAGDRLGAAIGGDADDDDRSSGYFIIASEGPCVVTYSKKSSRTHQRLLLPEPAASAATLGAPRVKSSVVLDAGKAIDVVTYASHSVAYLLLRGSPSVTRNVNVAADLVAAYAAPTAGDSGTHCAAPVRATALPYASGAMTLDRTLEPRAFRLENCNSYFAASTTYVTLSGSGVATNNTCMRVLLCDGADRKRPVGFRWQLVELDNREDEATCAHRWPACAHSHSSDAPLLYDSGYLPSGSLAKHNAPCAGSTRVLRTRGTDVRLMVAPYPTGDADSRAAQFVDQFEVLVEEVDASGEDLCGALFAPGTRTSPSDVLEPLSNRLYRSPILPRVCSPTTIFFAIGAAGTLPTDDDDDYQNGDGDNSPPRLRRYFEEGTTTVTLRTAKAHFRVDDAGLRHANGRTLRRDQCNVTTDDADDTKWLVTCAVSGELPVWVAVRTVPLCAGCDVEVARGADTTDYNAHLGIGGTTGFNTYPPQDDDLSPPCAAYSAADAAMWPPSLEWPDQRPCNSSAAARANTAVLGAVNAPDTLAACGSDGRGGFATGASSCASLSDACKAALRASTVDAVGGACAAERCLKVATQCQVWASIFANCLGVTLTPAPTPPPTPPPGELDASAGATTTVHLAPLLLLLLLVSLVV